MMGDFGTFRQDVNELHEIQSKPPHRHSGFGVILDTTRAIPVSNLPHNEIQVQIKIIDQSINPVATPGDKYIRLFIYHKIDSPYPYVLRLGDIVRFINFEFHDYRGQTQGKNRQGSSWRIIDGREEEDMAEYSKSYEATEQNDQHLLDRIILLRKWSHTFFQKYSVKLLDWYSLQRHLEDPQRVFNFDHMAQILEIRHTLAGDYLEMLIEDELGDRYITMTTLVHEGKIEPGMIVKLRGIEKIDGDRMIPNFKYTAVMPIPDFFLDHKFFLKTLEENKQKASAAKADANLPLFSESVETSVQNQPAVQIGTSYIRQPERYVGYNISRVELNKQNPNSAHPVCSVVKNDHKNIGVIPIKQAMDFLKDITIEEALTRNVVFRFCAYVIDIHPKSLKDAVKFFEEKTGALLNFDQVEQADIDRRKLKPTYLIRMLWKDASIENSDEVLATYVFSYDENPCYIFPSIDIKNKTKAEILNQMDTYDKKVVDELLFNPDRLYEFLVEPFTVIGKTTLDTLDGQAPLRIKDTVFLEVNS